MNFSVTPLPLVARHPDGPLRVFDIAYVAVATHAGQSASLTVHAGKALLLDRMVPIVHEGQNQIEIRIPELTELTQQHWQLTMGDVSQDLILEVQPVRQWQVHISLHSHTDLGFTDTISNVAEIHADNTDQAMELMELTADWPVESRFRWTIEITWQLEQYFKLRGPEAVQRLQKYLQSSQMELAAMYAGEHVDALGHEEAIRSFYLAAKYRRELDIPVDTAMLCDVPGSTEGLVQIMARSGIKNFIIADNNFCAPILARTDLPRPFNWISSNGDEVTTWYTDHPFFAYIEGRHYGVSESARAARKKLPYRLLEQEQKGYAHDLLHVQYAFDNFRLEFTPALVVREWNETWEWPKLELSTPRRFFNALRASDAEIPNRSGDFNEWWTSAMAHYPVEAALAKRLHDQIPSVEILSTLLHGTKGSKSPQNAFFGEIYNKLLAWDEHSGNGQIWAAEDPTDEISALDQGYAFIYDAQSNLEQQLLKLKSSLSGLFQRTGCHTHVMANTLPWSRTGPARIDDLRPNTIYCLFDHLGQALSHGHLSDSQGKCHIYIPEVPGLGYRTLELRSHENCACETSISVDSKQIIQKDTETLTLKSESLEVQVDLRSGRLIQLMRISDGEFIHLSELTTGLGDVEFWESELADPVQMGRYIRSYYEGVPGKPRQLELPAACGVHVQEFVADTGQPGIRINHNFGEQIWLVHSITLDSHGKRLVLDYEFKHEGLIESGMLDTLQHTPRMPSMIFIAFPTNLEKPSFSYESTGMNLVAGHNQFKGSNFDYYAVHRWAMLRDNNAALAIYPADSLIVDPGQPGLNTFRSELPEDCSTLYFRVTPSTGWKDRKWGMGYLDQDLCLRFELEYINGSELSNAQEHIQRHGSERATELITTALDQTRDGPLAPGLGEWMTLEGQGVEMTTLKPSEFDSENLIIRLREVSGEETYAIVTPPRSGFLSVGQCQMTEEVLDWDSIPDSGELVIHLAPFEIKTLSLSCEKVERLKS